MFCRRVKVLAVLILLAPTVEVLSGNPIKTLRGYGFGGPHLVLSGEGYEIFRKHGWD